MRLRAWFNAAFKIQRNCGGAPNVVVNKRNSLKFSTPCSHNASLNRTISPSQQKRGLLETHYYCLCFPKPNAGLSTTRMYELDSNEIERVNMNPRCYANPQVFEWLMGFPVNWTLI